MVHFQSNRRLTTISSEEIEAFSKRQFSHKKNLTFPSGLPEGAYLLYEKFDTHSESPSRRSITQMWEESCWARAAEDCFQSSWFTIIGNIGFPLSPPVGCRKQGYTDISFLWYYLQSKFTSKLLLVILSFPPPVFIIVLYLSNSKSLLYTIWFLTVYDKINVIYILYVICRTYKQQNAENIII